MLIETDNIITSSQIAAMLGVAPSAVSNWKKRHKDFPEPIFVAPTTQGPPISLYDVEKVLAWYEERFGAIKTEHLDTSIERLEAMKARIERRSNGQGTS